MQGAFGDEPGVEHGEAGREGRAGSALIDADHDGGAAAGGGGGGGLAEGSGGHDAAIAEAGCAVDHEEAGVLDEAGVLQAVIHQQGGGPGGDGGAGGGGAVGADPGGGDLGQEEGLVADHAGGVDGGIDEEGAADATAVAAAEAYARRRRGRGGGRRGPARGWSFRRRRRWRCRSRGRGPGRASRAGRRGGR